MSTTKYIPIDKNVIDEGMIVGFDLFVSADTDKEVECFKRTGSLITNDEKNVIDTINTLYVEESQYSYYEEFYKNILESQTQSTYISFEEKSASIYKNASAVLNDLFMNPETLANYDVCKKVVNEIVETILDDGFTIKSLLSIAEHDYYTHTHSINVAIYALSLGSYIGLSQEALSELGESALLHDLGKSKINPAIINKKGKLTEDEFMEIQKHPNLGYAIGMKLGIKNKNILNGIRHHHEKIDGSGYPSKMKGKMIPLYARIIGICDIFDALTTRRSYKNPMTTFDALKLMKINMKDHIDINLLNKMITMFK
ncbi:HD-GYP domain-containing protein [Sulfurimonas sp. HSL-1716]|uniref:HD-GYP domain-containing protein n=1 Tax=Hydrocurvibacter sulfurireducens TaxID=3131937 RepID=UPI0031F7CA28